MFLGEGVVAVQVDELAGKSVGARIQAHRERRGMSRPVLAGLVGRSADWLKKVEKGHLLPPRLSMLVRIAEALGLPGVAELVGDQSTLVDAARRVEGHDAVPAIRAAVERPLLVVETDAVPNANELRERADHAWWVWHSSASPRADVGRLLPRLIRDARHATRVLDGRERRIAYATLTAIYALVEQVIAWVSDSALLWLSADRCMAAAEQADDPDSLAAASWVVGNVWRATGREDDALRLANDAADLLAPYLETGSDDSRALFGACRLHAALTAARLGREGDALRYLDDADGIGARLPAGYAHPWTLFGRANTELTGVSVHVGLRKGGTALDKASVVDPDALPSLDRRARLWLETARAYAQRRDYTSALHVLQRATSLSGESMRCHPLSRGLAAELVTSGGRLIEREARELATRLGVQH
ncbi:helix-turn-helix domain-containing protein [Saccharomonospora saliphila]|uniref:helix-turn-helix domain-containing protein n=1 Tax=Saccharomonospora saliphila TaxID=369829 RepID=UPI00066225B7|nr:helix-turn-helix transcriptional regulator [Saccharomonospora saliphila]